MSAIKAITKFFQMSTEEHRPSKMLPKKYSHGIPFNPLKQYAMNTNLIIQYIECSKARIVFLQKKIPAGRVRAFKKVTHDLLFVCGSSVEELAGSKNLKEFHNPQNLKCIGQVGFLYYSVEFTSCCSH